MNRHQRKLHKLAKIMYLSQLTNNPNFNDSFSRHYKMIKWLYGGKDSSEKEIDEVLYWCRYVNGNSN